MTNNSNTNDSPNDAITAIVYGQVSKKIMVHDIWYTWQMNYTVY